MWIIYYIPVFLMLFFISIEEHRHILFTKKKKGRTRVTNDLLKSYIGMVCMISTGSFGTSVKGRIKNVVENWIEIETKKGKELINSDFITNIKPISE